MKSFIIFAFYVICYVEGWGAKECICSEPTGWMEEIGCIPIKDKGSCCPKWYDCSKYFSNLSPHWCVFQGKSYSWSEKIPEHLISPHCHPSCSCYKNSTSSAYPDSDFHCAFLFCYNETSTKCLVKYEENNCCALGEMCPPFKNLTTCSVGGKTYYEGQRFYNDDRSKRCICQKGFRGYFEEPFCIDRKCVPEIMYSKSIQKYCAPVFFMNDWCPFKFICPEPEDIIRPNRTPPRSTLKCKFGSLELHIGDKFERTKYVDKLVTEVTTCECKIGPFVTCHQTSIHV